MKRRDSNVRDSTIKYTSLELSDMHGGAATAASEAMYSTSSSMVGSSDNLLHDDDAHAHTALDTAASAAAVASLHDIESKGTAATTGLLLSTILYTLFNKSVVYSMCMY
jgi:hypothetical protein